MLFDTLRNISIDYTIEFDTVDENMLQALNMLHHLHILFIRITLENLPAEFVKGTRKSDGQPYYCIVVDLSAEPGERHPRAFYADGMTVKMCEKFITQHTFDEAVYDVESEDEEEAGVNQEE